MKKPSRLASFALHTALALWLLLAVLPIAWAALISFRPYVDAFAVPIKWWAPLTLENYQRLWIEREFYRNFSNTVVVTLCTVTLSLSVGCLAGYALSRYRGATGFALLMAALVFRALPHSSLLPSFLALFDALGLRNTTISLVLVAINQPFTIWMLRAFFVSISIPLIVLVAIFQPRNRSWTRPSGPPWGALARPGAGVPCASLGLDDAGSPPARKSNAASVRRGGSIGCVALSPVW